MTEYGPESVFHRAPKFGELCETVERIETEYPGSVSSRLKLHLETIKKMLLLNRMPAPVLKRIERNSAQDARSYRREHLRLDRERARRLKRMKSLN